MSINVNLIKNVAIARGIVKLGDLEPGNLFLYNDTIALKTEYTSIRGIPECYILGSGEMFYGGFTKADDIKNLLVTPIKIY